MKKAMATRNEAVAQDVAAKKTLALLSAGIGFFLGLVVFGVV